MKILVCKTGFADRGEPVVPGFGAVGAVTRKAVKIAEVVESDDTLDAIAERTMKATFGSRAAYERVMGAGSWDKAIDGQIAGLRDFYGKHAAPHEAGHLIKFAIPRC